MSSLNKKLIFKRFKKCDCCKKARVISLFKHTYHCLICDDVAERNCWAAMDEYYESLSKKRTECLDVAKNYLNEYQMKELKDYIEEDEENNQIYSFEIKDEDGIPLGDEDIDSSLSIFSSSCSVGESGDSYEGSTYINLNKDNKYLVYHWSC